MFPVASASLGLAPLGLALDVVCGQGIPATQITARSRGSARFGSGRLIDSALAQAHLHRLGTGLRAELEAHDLTDFLASMALDKAEVVAVACLSMAVMTSPLTRPAVAAGRVHGGNDDPGVAVGRGGYGV